jgi:hypothetical protein
MTRCRLTDERALSKRQLMLVHSEFLRWLARPLLPKGWAAGSFKTAGEVDAQRVALQKLGTRLAVLSIASFLCKCASSAASYFAAEAIAQSEESESIIFLVTILSVQAVPSLVTLLLLHQFYFDRSGSGRGTLMQSLLKREISLIAGVQETDATATNEGLQT